MEQYLIHYSVSEFHADIRKIVAETIRDTKPQSKEPIRPEYLTRQQVKEKLHVSFPTLNRFDKEGILTAHKIGGRVLYLWSDVEKAINPEQQPIKYRRVNSGR
jgi:hypothetical protein